MMLQKKIISRLFPCNCFKYVRKHFTILINYTNEGDTVLDPTMGSGSTGVACNSLNRKFIGIEMNEEYFNVASKRIIFPHS